MRRRLAAALLLMFSSLPESGQAQSVEVRPPLARRSGDTASFELFASGDGGTYTFGDPIRGAPMSTPDSTRPDVALFTVAFDPHLSGTRRLAVGRRHYEVEVARNIRKLGIYVVHENARPQRKPDYFELAID